MSFALAGLLLACAPLVRAQEEPVERFQPTLAEDASLELEAFWEPC